jgi:hypothetical protein
MNFYNSDIFAWMPIGIFIVIFFALLSVIQYLRNREKERKAIEKIKSEDNVIVLDNGSEERKKGNVFTEFFRSLGQRAKKEKPEESSQTRLRF